MLEGIMIVNKPTGITSHDVVDRARRKFRMRRIGHAGTLDPLATGVLILLLGKATKLFNEFVGMDKGYRAKFILGTRTTSADIQGKVVEQLPFDQITRNKIEQAFDQFSGEIEQIPPMVSAVKVKGKKLYELARKGLEVERPARKVTIHSLRLESFQLPEVRFYLECSKGTYVRQIAEDIGKMLGCGACISEIERTKVGPFQIDDAVKLEDLNESHLKHWKECKTV